MNSKWCFSVLPRRLTPQVSYQQLVDLFFSRHDATTMNRQKNDVGTQYRSAIFTHGAEQQEVRRAQADCFAMTIAWDGAGYICSACDFGAAAHMLSFSLAGQRRSCRQSCLVTTMTLPAQIALAGKAKVPGAVTEVKPIDVFYPAVSTVAVLRYAQMRTDVLRHDADCNTSAAAPLLPCKSSMMPVRF